MAETALEGRTDGQTTCKARRCRIAPRDVPHDVGEVALISNAELRAAVSGDNIEHVICRASSQTLSNGEICQALSRRKGNERLESKSWT